MTMKILVRRVILISLLAAGFMMVRNAAGMPVMEVIARSIACLACVTVALRWFLPGYVTRAFKKR